MTVYADSSFLVSVYVEDTHSAEGDARLRTGSTVLLTPLHLAEWAHAIAQQVFRGRLSAAEAIGVEQAFDEDRRLGLWKEVVMPDKSFDACADLARRYGPKLGVRTLDSLHVACALELKAQRFWTFDERQARLARAVGMKTG